MGNRIGVIFHDDWNEFSPLLYSHNGANLIPFQIQAYIRDYYEKHDINNIGGHEYKPSHMMAGFIKFLKEDTHMRIKNLNKNQIDILINNNEYPNCFEGGCWIINVSRKNYGATVEGDGYWLDNANIFKDKLLNDYDLY
jgi:hypothetical protein